jgi:hmcD domain protein
LKKSVLLLSLASIAALASDPITIDSLFKKQLGLRSVTSLSLLSSGNPNTYTSYPDILINGDPAVWSDTKQLTLNQTLMYAITSKLDLITAFGGSYKRNEYVDYFTLDPKSRSKASFDSFWLGLNYRADSINELVPTITFQTAIIQRETAVGKSQNFYFKSYSLKGTLRGYSDPVVYSIYSGIGYNQPRNFKFAKIQHGHSLYFGGDLSIILSPKITLDLGIEQRFQTASKVNGRKTNNIRSIPTYNVGSTYSINDDTSITFSATLGGSSAAPDSIFGISLWKKF